jgi:hypothetical protein
MAQAGGRRPDKINEAIALGFKRIKEEIEGCT